MQGAKNHLQRSGTELLKLESQTDNTDILMTYKAVISKGLKRHHEVGDGLHVYKFFFLLSIGSGTPFYLVLNRFTHVLKGKLTCVWVENHASCFSLFS